MAIVNKVDKRVKVNKDDIIKYQILTYCFLNKIQVSNNDLDCLKELAKIDNVELTSFCQIIADKKIFKSEQSVRNAIQKAKVKGLVDKKGKIINISSDLNLQSKGNVFLDFKILSVEE